MTFRADVFGSRRAFVVRRSSLSHDNQKFERPQFFGAHVSLPRFPSSCPRFSYLAKNLNIAGRGIRGCYLWLQCLGCDGGYATEMERKEVEQSESRPLRFFINFHPRLFHDGAFKPVPGPIRLGPLKFPHRLEADH